MHHVIPLAQGFCCSSLRCHTSLEFALAASQAMCKKDPFKKPVIQKDCVAIACGLLKTPAVITPRGPDDAYVEVMKSTPWLCLATTGTCYKSGPLGRTRLLEAFKVEMNNVAAADETPPVEHAPAKTNKADKMNLLFANMPPGSLPAPAAKIEPIAGRAYRKHSRVKAPRADKNHIPATRKEFTKTIKHPLHFGGQELAEWRLWRKSGSDAVWLHVDDLVAAVEYLHSEAAQQGVLPSAEDGSGRPALADGDERPDIGGSCSFDRRDYMWQVRVSGSTEVHRKSFAVPTKNVNTGECLTLKEFIEAKIAVRKAAMEWMDDMKTQ